MKIAIIGAGVQGLISAYYLAKNGVEVTVIDQESGPALQTSMANGGILSYAMPAGWNAPGSAKMFFNALLNPSKAPIQFKLKALPAMIPWGLKFLSYTNTTDFIRLTRANQRLAAYSQSCLEDILNTTSIDCHHVEKGFLEIFEDEQSLLAHVNETKSIVVEPDKVKLLDADQVVKYEPSLTPIHGKLAGAILLEAEKSGDCYAFCQRLAELLETMGVTFHYNTAVQKLSKNGEDFILETSQGQMSFNQLVIAAGNGSPAIAKKIGIYLPMKPSKGFSFTLPTDTMPVAPKGPIVDIGTKSGVNCFGGETLRYVGGAEFAGLDRSTPQEYWRRAENFFARIFPDFDAKPLIKEATPWVGFRPVCVDGVPIIGPTKVSGLYINTGHGALGWTFAAGSSKLVADQILGRNTPKNSINADDYRLNRFS